VTRSQEAILLNPDRAFKGVWINAELWTNTELSHTEKFLIAEIDSLTSEDHPCFASNQRLAEMIQISISQANDLLSTLQKRKYLVCVGFDGLRKFRVVTPLLSSNPSTAKQWIGGKRFQSLPENRKPPPGKPSGKPEPFRKTGRKGSGKPEPPYIEESTNRDKKGAADAAAFTLSSESEQKQEKSPGRKPANFEELRAFCLWEKISDSDAQFLWNNFESNGWTRNHEAIKDWKATIRTWHSGGWLPSQKRGGSRPPPKDDHRKHL
jgi:hypothetical protein